ncbi:MAG: transposase [Phycisphaerae bacterium]
MTDEQTLGDDERTFLSILWQRCPRLETTAQLAREFAAMVHDKTPEDLQPWMTRVAEAEIPHELKVFARGLKSDYRAVEAALTLPWSNGPVEGHINRLKLIKRQMYGRASFDLLRQRVLHRV